jgi:septal ring factor EnvC (AmiA/AmiB activator)
MLNFMAKYFIDSYCIGLLTVIIIYCISFNLLFFLPLYAQVRKLEFTLHQETIHSNQLEADLQEAQQEAERVGVRCQGLELELKQRDLKLEDLSQELEQRGQDLAGSNLRIRTLEEALSAKEPEIQIKVEHMLIMSKVLQCCK